MREAIDEVVILPDGVSASVEDGFLLVKGSCGEVGRELRYPGVSVKIEGDKVKFSCEKATKREKKMIFTMKAHLANMIAGVQKPFVYRLKICSGHFPMNVSKKGNELFVKNYLGEKCPRVLKLKQGVDVKVEGDMIVVTDVDKDRAGMVASDIERLMYKQGRDTRVYQDGIYLVEKAGVKVK